MPAIRDTRFLRVKLDMVGRCQLRCVMCHFAHPDFVENKTTMGEGLLEKVAADLFPRAHDVVLSSSAEPLMAPDLPRALELCRQYDVPNFHFSTNGMSLTEAIVDKVIEVQMPLITISFDAAKKETFERIRTPAKFDRVLSRFDVIRERREHFGSKFPEVSVTAVLMKSNIEEIPDLIRLMHEKGVRYMNFVHMAVIGGMNLEDESLLKHPKLSNQIMAEAKRVADELGMETVMPIPLDESAVQEAVEIPSEVEGGGNALTGPEDKQGETFSVDQYLNHKNREFLLKVPEKEHHNRPCYFPWYYIHVNPDGTVFPCGSWWEHTTFGDFKTQTFEEIWTGEKYTELRRQLHNMELRETCANCAVSNMGRPDVKASFAQRAKVRTQARSSQGV